jgi:hypothetical protein
LLAAFVAAVRSKEVCTAALLLCDHAIDCCSTVLAYQAGCIQSSKFVENAHVSAKGQVAFVMHIVLYDLV